MIQSPEFKWVMLFSSMIQSNLLRTLWRIGKVEKLLQGSDGLVQGEARIQKWMEGVAERTARFVRAKFFATTSTQQNTTVQSARMSAMTKDGA